MGVTGLWKLIEPSGKPVPLETLENKVLAIDISIWMHQVIKGFQDSRGAPIPNAHLLGLFNRLCKLLYYRIKPVFVFDGGVPNLKIETIAKRNQNKNKYVTESERIQQQLLNTLAKHKAIKHLLKGKVKDVSPKKNSSEKALNKLNQEEDLFKLPPMKDKDILEEEILSDSTSDSSENNSWTDLHTVDVECQNFKSLPLEMRHDILTDLKESRKQSSWGRLHELPEESDDFSSLQMRRLRKRRAVQVSLDEVEKEMGGHTLSMSELEKILTEDGILAASCSSSSKRIVSDDSKKYLYIKDLNEALKKAMHSNDHSVNKLAKIDEGVNNDNSPQKLQTSNIIKPISKISLSQLSTEKCNVDDEPTVAELPNSSKNVNNINVVEEDLGYEYDEELEAAIKLSLQTVDCEDQSILSEYNIDSVLEKDGATSCNLNHMALARAYMMENCDFTQEEIHKIISGENTRHLKRNRNQTNVVELEGGIKISNQISQNSCNPVQDTLQIHNVADTNKIINDKLNNKSKHDESDLVSTELHDTKNLNEEISTKYSDPIQEISSDSDDDFIEVLPNIVENKIVGRLSEDTIHLKTVKQLSSNADSEFIDASKNSTISKPIEIFIDKNKVKDDEDIFADIFENVQTNKELKLQEEKQIIIESEQKNSNNSVLKSESNSAVEKKTKEFEESTTVISPLIDTNLSSIPEKADNLSIVSDTNVIDLTNFDENKQGSPKNSSVCSAERSETVCILSDTDTVSSNNPNSETVYNQATVVEPSVVLNKQDLERMSSELEVETDNLISEISKQHRMGNSVTSQMTKEVQELLQLFGIPYIIAPMEAEAQCAFLNDIKLTDGTITDDSDIWLFGGKTVYKNFFNQKKYVLEFKSENIYNHFKLTRDQLIQFALLVGSDYTTGIQSIGPVTALEILAAFPSDDNILTGLSNFKIWCETGQAVGPGRTALKSKLKKITISDGFPSNNVVKAYLEPTVETSKEQFRWGHPDISTLREYTRTKFGWTTAKTEDILKPVIAKMNIKQTQKSIKDFFNIRDFKIGSVDKLSKRVQFAVDKLSGKVDDNDTADTSEKKKRKKKLPCKSLKQNTKQQNTKIAKVNKRLLSKETIPQKEKDKSELMKNKMKAIEVFRKSKCGPGFVEKRKSLKNEPLSDANLSESSDE